MPTLQSALPPELADNVIRLYRECMRRARFVGHQQHNTALVVDMVRRQFRKHMHETDPEKIQMLKDDAARGLINHILYESEKITAWLCRVCTDHLTNTELYCSSACTRRNPN